MSKTNKILLGIVTIVILWLGYTALIVVPRERIVAKAQAERLENYRKTLLETEAKEEYSGCKTLAYTNYSLNWEAKCKLLGKSEECTLRISEGSKAIEERYNDALADCLSIYKAR